MRIQAYLRILSDEAAIRAIHKNTDVPDASIRPLKSKRNATTDEVWWNWETARVPIDANKPDDGLNALLTRYRPLFPIIKRHSGPKTDIYLELITNYEKHESPHGIYLSRETIALISELGGALDNDVYFES